MIFKPNRNPAGPQHYLDWRAREKACGGNWQREPVWTPDLEFDDGREYEPTLYEMYKSDLKPVREMMASSLAIIVMSGPVQPWN